VKRISRLSSIALLGIYLLTANSLLAQENSIDVATDITLEEWQAVLNAPEGGVDRQVKVVDIGKSNVAVGVLHRGQVPVSDQPVRGIVHTLVTEVYYVTSGSGVLVTGGTVTNRRDVPDPEDNPIVTTIVGESFFGAVARGDGQVREISEGDLVVIPAGVFHGWHEVEDHVTYLSIRPDPDKVLPEGYVNPYAN